MGSGGRSTMKTVLVPPGSLMAGGAVDLSPEEGRHLRVRRAEDEEIVRLCDGRGAVAEGQLERGEGTARVLVTRVEQVTPPVPLVLAVGAGDRERFGWLVEKCVELGATEIIPLDSDRSRNVATRLRPTHLARLAYRARETLKQCERAWATFIRPLTTLEQLLALELPAVRWLADRAGAAPEGLTSESALTVAVGPEGGFTEEERQRLVAAGFQPICFGRAVLRFETAAVSAAAYVSILRRRGQDE